MEIGGYIWRLVATYGDWWLHMEMGGYVKVSGVYLGR